MLLSFFLINIIFIILPFQFSFYINSYLGLFLVAALLLGGEVKSKSVGRIATEWGTTCPSCSTHSLPGSVDGEATNPSSSDNICCCCCCFFKRAFCFALSLARFAFARSCGFQEIYNFNITKLDNFIYFSNRFYNILDIFLYPF